jgi:hypothetical protein
VSNWLQLKMRRDAQRSWSFQGRTPPCFNCLH